MEHRCPLCIYEESAYYSIYLGQPIFYSQTLQPVVEYLFLYF
jgi:hypothetical protein